MILDFNQRGEPFEPREYAAVFGLDAEEFAALCVVLAEYTGGLEPTAGAFAASFLKDIADERDAGLAKRN